MKALCTLMVLALLTGCSNRIPAPKSEQKIYSDVPKSGNIKTVFVNKTKSTTDFAESQNTLSTTSASEPGQFYPSEILEVGSQGDAVRTLEQRLSDLHYDVGVVDSFYTQLTRLGVVAFQKYTGLKRTGTYTLETQKALHVAKPPEGLHPELGLPRIEIDIERQVLLFFDEQGINRVIAVSTGSNRNYCEISKKSGKQVCGVAHTPQGKFRIQSRIPGWRLSDLGELFNPLYFNGGFAIHGSPSVPEHNVSHGCVRIPIPTALWFYDTIKDGTPVIVFD